MIIPDEKLANQTVGRHYRLSSNIKVATEIVNLSILTDLYGMRILRLPDHRNEEGIPLFDAVDITEKCGTRNEKQ